MNQQRLRYVVGYAALLIMAGASIGFMLHSGYMPVMDFNFAYLFRGTWVTFASFLAVLGMFGPVGLQPGGLGSSTTINNTINATLPFITVSLPNQGASAPYASTNQSGFNAAVTFLNTTSPSGGTIFVKPGNYATNGEWLLTGTNITVIFSGATITLPNNTLFFSSIISGGGKTWTSIFVAGAAVNCSVYSLNITSNNLTNTSISGLVLAGGNNNVQFYSQTSNNCTRWARSHTGYLQLSTGQTFDGGNNGIQYYSPCSNGCGSNGIPDGGGCKFFNGCTSGVGYGTNKNITEYYPNDQNFAFASWDSNPQNNFNGAYHENIERYGGNGLANNNAVYWNPAPSGTSFPPRPGLWFYSVTASANANIVLSWTGVTSPVASPSTLVSGATAGQTYSGQFKVTAQMIAIHSAFTISNVSAFPQTNIRSNYICNQCFGLFNEAAFAASTRGAKFFGGRYDMAGGTGAGPGVTNTGLIIGLSNRNMEAWGVQFINADTGWTVQAFGLQPEQGGDITLDGLRSLRCGTAASITVSGGDQGSACTTFVANKCIGDDEGSGQMSVGLQFGVSTQKPLLYGKFTHCDFSKIASGGTIFANTSNFAGQIGLSFEDCAGITDQGFIANPFGTSTTSEIRALGGNIASNSPTTGITWNNWNKNCTISLASGSTTSAAVLFADGSNLWWSSATEGSSFSPTASVWYLIRDPAGQTWSITGDSSVNCFAIGPDQTVYMNQGASFSNLFLPQNTLVTLGAFTGSPTVTVNGIANPFVQVTGLTTINPANPMFMPYGAQITWTVGTSPTIVVTVNGNVIASPWYRYRELSMAGATALPTGGGSNIIYEVFGTPIIINIIGATAFNLLGPDGSAIATGLTALTAYRLERGYKIQWTNSSVGTILCYTAP